MIFRKKIYLIVLLWIISIFGVLVFLLGTNIGTNLIVNKFVDRIPELNFDSVSGSWGNFDVTNLSYHLPWGVINIDSFRISINLKYILFKQINIEHIFLKNVLIKTKKNIFFNKIKDTNQIDGINNIFKNLHSIILKNIILDNIHIIYDNIEFRCHKISSGFMLVKSFLKILPTCMVEGSILTKLPINLFFNKYDVIMIHRMFYSKKILNIESVFKSTMQNLLKILPQYNIPIGLICTNIQGKNFRICSDDCDHNNCHIVDGFQITGNWNKEIANMKLKINLPDGCLNSVASILFNNYYRINIQADYVYNNPVKYGYKNELESTIKNIKLIITGSLIDTICIYCDILNIVSVIRILLEITLKDLEIPIKLFVTGKEIPITVLRKNKYILKEFNLYLSGKLYENYIVKIKSTVINLNRDSIYISLHACGDINSFSISKLKLKILNGYCEMHGIVNWEKTISWNNIYVFNNINIFQSFLKYPIVLSGKIVIKGSLSADSWTLMVSDFHCHGRIQDNQISCYGSIYVDSQSQLNIPMFLISWGSNILLIKGAIQKNHIIDMNLKLKLNCFDFLPQLNSGVIRGELRIHGITTFPEFVLKMDINNIDFGDQNINFDHIMIMSNFFYKNPTKNNFSLVANRIRYKDLFLHQLCMHGKGDLSKHDLNIIICGDKISGIINCIGQFNFKYQIWNGQISKTKILTPIGTWELMQDIVLMYQCLPRKMIIKSHYWKSSDFQFIISDSMQKNIFQKINLICKDYFFTYSNIIPIKSISASDVCLSCSDMYWAIDNSISSLPQGTMCLSSSELNVKYLDQKNISFILINNITANLVFTQIDFFCHCIINTNKNKNIIKFLITDVYDRPKILGIIQIKSDFLTPILQLLLKLEQPFRGILNIDINFTGCLYCPKIYGVLQLEGFFLNHSNVPFFVKKGTLEVKCFGNYAMFNGVIYTEDDHKLYCNGEIIDINSINHIRMLINVRGDQIGINISPIMYAKISPNLVFTITAEKIDIKGDILVPSASVVVQELTKNTVETSSEEVILDDKYQIILDKSKFFSVFVSAIVNIYLGDHVNFSGLGLNGKLKGNLEMIYNQNDFTLIGHVNIYSGCIEVYGQNLIIKKGQLLFSGALNQTYFDIEAIRNPVVFPSFKDSVTAGIRITGLINQLKLDFFSDSSLLSQQEIMSYLLGGSSIFSNTGDTNIITSLLIGIGIKKYEKLINKVGEVLGVRDLKLRTQEFSMPSVIALSGYIAPGLQVQYGINIFDLLTTMTIRYCVHPKLYLEVKSGSHNQSLDLLYQFDFN